MATVTDLSGYKDCFFLNGALKIIKDKYMKPGNNINYPAFSRKIFLLHFELQFL